MKHCTTCYGTLHRGNMGSYPEAHCTANCPSAQRGQLYANARYQLLQYIAYSNPNLDPARLMTSSPATSMRDTLQNELPCKAPHVKPWMRSSATCTNGKQRQNHKQKPAQCRPCPLTGSYSSGNCITSYGGPSSLSPSISISPLSPVFYILANWADIVWLRCTAPACCIPSVIPPGSTPPCNVPPCPAPRARPPASSAWASNPPWIIAVPRPPHPLLTSWSRQPGVVKTPLRGGAPVIGGTVGPSVRKWRDWRGGGVTEVWLR